MKNVNVLHTVGVLLLSFFGQNVKRAHCFKAARNMRLGPCNITNIIEWDYPSLQGHFLTKKDHHQLFKGPSFLQYTSTAEATSTATRLFPYEKCTKANHLDSSPSVTQRPWLNSLSVFFFSFNNLTKPVSPHTSALQCKRSFKNPQWKKNSHRSCFCLYFFRCLFFFSCCIHCTIVSHGKDDRPGV